LIVDKTYKGNYRQLHALMCCSSSNKADESDFRMGRFANGPGYPV
jgi:hypothetical protein